MIPAAIALTKGKKIKDTIKEKMGGIPEPVIVAGGITLAGLGLYYWVVKPVIKTLTDQSGASEDFDKGAKEVENKIAADGSRVPTLTANEAKSIANIQEEAMGNPWTDFTRLKNSLMSLNGKDLQLVYTSFATRYYDPLTGSSSGWLWPTAVNTDLFGWYGHELSNKELAEMQTIWNKSGLKFYTAGLGCPQLQSTNHVKFAK